MVTVDLELLLSRSLLTRGFAVFCPVHYVALSRINPGADLLALPPATFVLLGSLNGQLAARSSDLDTTRHTDLFVLFVLTRLTR
jgi:hypothetical protein